MTSSNAMVISSFIPLRFLWFIYLYESGLLDSSSPEWNGHHFADYSFKYIFIKEIFRSSILISLEFVPKGQIDNNSTIFSIQVLAWRRAGEKPLSEAMQSHIVEALTSPLKFLFICCVKNYYTVLGMFDDVVIVKRNYLSNFLVYLALSKQRFQQRIVLVHKSAPLMWLGRYFYLILT